MTPSPPTAAPAATPQQPTAAQLDELERLEREATPGPWFSYWSERGQTVQIGTGWLFVQSVKAGQYDAAFIAALRNAAPALIAGCRAAGAATPPATALGALQGAVMEVRPSRPRMPTKTATVGEYLNGFNDAKHAVAQMLLMHPALTVGAGVATPASTTMIDVKQLEVALQQHADAQPWRGIETVDFRAGWDAAMKAAPPESRDTPPRQTFEAWYEDYHVGRSIRFSPGPLRDAWDAAVAAVADSGAAGATTAAQEKHGSSL